MVVTTIWPWHSKTQHKKVGNTKGTSTTGDGIDAQASSACVPTQTGSGGGGASSTTETNATNSSTRVTAGENKSTTTEC